MHPSPPPSAQWIVYVGAGVALCSALVGVGFLASQSGGGRGGAAGGGAGEGAGRRAPGGVTASAEAAGRDGRSATAALLSPPRKPPLSAGGLGSGEPGGWAGASGAAAARRPSLGEAIDDLRAALASNDPDRIGLAEARLRSYLSGDEGRALELLELFKRETDPAVQAVLAGVLAADPVAAASSAIASALAAIAEDPSAPQARREQALSALALSSASVPDLERRLAALARSPDPDFRQAALAALSSRAQSLPAGSGGREAVTALLRAVQAERDPEIRAAFLAGAPLRDAPESAVDDVRSAMRSDPSPSVREAAAHALGDVPASARGGTIAAIEQAFRSESDPGTRRAMLISLVRIAGPGALPPIERLRPVAGDTRVDCEDYIEILRSGETQADRIFDLKVAREIARGGPSVGGHDHEE